MGLLDKAKEKALEAKQKAGEVAKDAKDKAGQAATDAKNKNTSDIIKREIPLVPAGAPSIRASVRCMKLSLYS